MTIENAMKAKEQCLVIDQSTTIMALLDHTDCKALLGSGTTKFYVKTVFSYK